MVLRISFLFSVFSLSQPFFDGWIVGRMYAFIPGSGPGTNAPLRWCAPRMPSTWRAHWSCGGFPPQGCVWKIPVAIFCEEFSYDTLHLSMPPIPQNRVSSKHRFGMREAPWSACSEFHELPPCPRRTPQSTPSLFEKPFQHFPSWDSPRGDAGGCGKYLLLCLCFTGFHWRFRTPFPVVVPSNALRSVQVNQVALSGNTQIYD